MKELSNNDHVVFLGEAKFPYGLASIQRMTLMGKALVHEGIKVTVVCRKGSWRTGEHTDFDYQGIFEGIDYIYTSKTVHRPNGFVKRTLNKLVGVYEEFKYLRRLKRNGKISLAILSNRKFVHVVRYLFIAKYLNFPIALNLVEMASAIQTRRRGLKGINNYVFDKWLIRFFDGALPISDKLHDYYMKISPNKPCIKLPIICDFDKFKVDRKKVPSYFLYCGSIEYRQVIDFVVSSFKSLDNKTNTLLYMIVSGGGKKETKRLQEQLNNEFVHGQIKLFSNIPYSQLVDLYRNATALLIPLRHTVQDASRFPHKLGEYLASGNPVITTNVGEIRKYFNDGETALICEKYDEEDFAKKMQFVLENVEVAKRIGESGKIMGFKEFDYRTHGKVIIKFIGEIQGNFKSA